MAGNLLQYDSHKYNQNIYLCSKDDPDENCIKPENLIEDINYSVLNFNDDDIIKKDESDSIGMSYVEISTASDLHYYPLEAFEFSDLKVENPTRTEIDRVLEIENDNPFYKTKKVTKKNKNLDDITAEDQKELFKEKHKILDLTSADNIKRRKSKIEKKAKNILVNGEEPFRT